MDLIETGMDLVEQGLRDANRAAGSLQITAWIYVGLDGDAQRAHDQVRARIATLLADPRIDRVVVSPQIGAPDQPITHDFISQFGEAVLARL